jgi:hypothetical protein
LEDRRVQKRVENELVVRQRYDHGYGMIQERYEGACLYCQLGGKVVEVINKDAIVHRYKGLARDVFNYPTFSEISLRSYQGIPIDGLTGPAAHCACPVDAAIHTFDI